MSLTVTTVPDAPNDVLALRLVGVAEERLLLTLVDGVHAAAEGKRRVVLDLDELVLFSAGAVRTFIAHLFERIGEDRVVLSCGRRTGRQVLRRWGGNEVSIMSTLDGALALATAHASLRRHPSTQVRDLGSIRNVTGPTVVPREQ